MWQMQMQMQNERQNVRTVLTRNPSVHLVR